MQHIASVRAIAETPTSNFPLLGAPQLPILDADVNSRVADLQGVPIAMPPGAVGTKDEALLFVGLPASGVAIGRAGLSRKAAVAECEMLASSFGLHSKEG